MALKYQKDKDSIVTLTIDMENQSVNIINEEYLISFQKNLKRLEKDTDLKGVIITSAKKSFLAGADLKTIYRQNDPQSCFNLVEENKTLMRRLELLTAPVVVAMNGTALGGGLELALCCNYRIALNNPKAKFGFPEVTLGLLPGGGGLTRLPRMIGIESSLPLLIEGKQLTILKALEKGLIEEIAHTEEEMFQNAREWILKNQDCKQPWDEKGFIFPGGDSQYPKMTSFLESSLSSLLKKTKGNYPAPEAIINVISEGTPLAFESASQIESRYFATLATGKVSKNLMQAFWFQMNEINSGSSRPSNIKPTTITKVGILGSGLMGHGIAYVTALAGINVVMTDANQEGAEKGFSKIQNILKNGLKKGILEQDKIDNILSRITVTSNYKDLKGCDLIVEAVFENQDLKGKVTIKAEKEMKSSGVFASNTSTIPITELAEKSSRSNQFIGIHFFSPVHKMKLVEIIKGEKTSPETLAKAFDYVLRIKKIPIVVNDSSGFYTTRVFERYTCEGMALLEEGVPPQVIEDIGKKAGYPVGPLAILDEINIGLAARIRDQNWRNLKSKGEKISTGPWDKVLNLMTEEVKRTGRSEGGGFYEYPEKEKKYLWPQLKQYFPSSEQGMAIQDIVDRYYFSQAIETIRCYEENVITSVADANIGSIFGWGFPSFKGGTLQFVNDYGLSKFRDRAQELSEKYGDRFTPPRLLLKMIKDEDTF